MTTPSAFRSPMPSLAIVGASARAAAASAVRAGFLPIAADLFADADLRRMATATRIAPYPDGLLDWLRAIEPPAWLYTGALENHAELVDQMAWVAPLWGNPGDVLARVRSPRELADVLRSAGLLFPETRSSPKDLPVDGSWLAKTYRGASGSGVRDFVGGVESHGTHQALETAMVGLAELDPPYGVVYQRRIHGTACSAVFVAAAGAASLLGMTRQLVGDDWLGAQGFQYAGSIGPWPVSDGVLATITRIGEVLASEFELVGLFGVDMVLDGEQIWTLEVNPRYTASVEIVERATGIQAIAEHAAACVGAGSRERGARSMADSRPPVSSPPRVHGKAILFAKREIVISDSFAAMALTETLRTPWPTLADISPAGSVIEAGRPILTLFADGASTDEVEQQLRQRVATLEQKLYTS